MTCYTVRLQKSGDGVNTSEHMIDIDSELLNITRKASKYLQKYLPT